MIGYVLFFDGVEVSDEGLVVVYSCEGSSGSDTSVFFVVLLD